MRIQINLNEDLVRKIDEYAAAICSVTVDQVAKLLEALAQAVSVVCSCVGLLELVKHSVK